MKPLFVKIDVPYASSIVCKEEREPYFFNPWHFHEEFELFHIVESTGTRFVGDNIERFADGELVFIGPRLPHIWKNDSCYFEGNPNLTARSILIQFKQGLIRNIISIPEFSPINALIEISRKGLKIYGDTQKQIISRMKNFRAMEQDEKILEIIRILLLLSKSGEYEILASNGYLESVQNLNSKRLNQVIEYIMNNFTKDISLETVAGIANLTKASFCRYFKERLKKSFSAFVIELRIGFAKKLLIDRNFSILQVAYECGYKNISNFNRQFKGQTGLTPSEYRKDQLKVIS